ISLFFTPPPTTAIYPLSLHDALPISSPPRSPGAAPLRGTEGVGRPALPSVCGLARSLPTATASPTLPARSCSAGGRPSLLSRTRSEEHTSELQSRGHLVCRLLLEK